MFFVIRDLAVITDSFIYRRFCPPTELYNINYTCTDSCTNIMEICFFSLKKINRIIWIKYYSKWNEFVCLLISAIHCNTRNTFLNTVSKMEYIILFRISLIFSMTDICVYHCWNTSFIFQERLHQTNLRCIVFFLKNVFFP